MIFPKKEIYGFNSRQISSSSLCAIGPPELCMIVAHGYSNESCNMKLQCNNTIYYTAIQIIMQDAMIGKNDGVIPESCGDEMMEWVCVHVQSIKIIVLTAGCCLCSQVLTAVELEDHDLAQSATVIESSDGYTTTSYIQKFSSTNKTMIMNLTGWHHEKLISFTWADWLKFTHFLKYFLVSKKNC